MIKMISLVALLACATSGRLLAFTGVASSICHNQIHMKRGRYVDKVWIGPEFNRSNGFIVSDVRYAVKVDNDAFVDYLAAAFNSIGKDHSSYNLVVTVVGFSEKVSSIRPYNSNRVRLEGRVFNRHEELIAAFQVERTFVPSIVDTNLAIDDVVRAVKKELR